MEYNEEDEESSESQQFKVKSCKDYISGWYNNFKERIGDESLKQLPEEQQIQI